MDGWQTAQNWSVFGVVAVGLTCYYYYPRNNNKQTPKLNPLKEVKKEVKSDVKKTMRKVESAAKKQISSVPVNEVENLEVSSKENGKNKRKANLQPTQQAPATPAEQQNDDDAIDMSTLQFAANMKKAREGVDMRKTDSKETRVKTVKTKAMDSPILSSGSSHNGEVGTEWSQVASPTMRSSGIDDMLEPAAPGPSTLRITAPTKPTKEKVNKQPKQVAAETKKQRQNRKKKEDERMAREDAESVRKVQQEQQRRTAREGRGEAARNGIPIPAAPINSPWSEQNAVSEVQLPAKTADGAQLLDTFDVESTGSSNADRLSTAATSTTDGPTDGNQSEVDDYAKAIEESERETGWNEVKSNKKTKKPTQSEATGQTTPVAKPVAKTAAAVKSTVNGKPVGFQALKDEYEHRTEGVDPSDADNWAA